MVSPIEKRGQVGCRIGQCLGAHYGRGLCRRHWAIWKRNTVKAEIVRSMGGVCDHCGGEFPPEVFDFHHRDADAKSFDVSDLLVDNPVAARTEALSKCDLLCANCHRVETRRMEKQHELF
jgi:hypothetical protein